jgi:hypothetical protein
MSQASRLLFVFLLAALVPVSVAFAQTDIYLYNDNVVEDVNIGAFLENGEVEMINVGKGEGGMKFVGKGPAPAPYPQVLVWEKDVERLGPNSFKVDGIRFINVGSHWVKNRKALVVWYVEIPNASARLPFEFEKDLTLSLWVDWNQDQMWGKGEKVIVEHINLQSFLPTTEHVLRVYYLTSFRVPDIDHLELYKKPGATDPPGQDKGIVNLWVRGIVSYDDPDVSPDGEQIFGEVEDYRVAYMKTPRNMKDE